MNLIFGSTAAKYWFPDFREPKDLDIISKDKLMTPEIQYYWQESFQYIINNNNDTKYVDPNFLYTIKVSHAAWDIHWDKTMHDIKFLKNKNCILDKHLYDFLLEEWEILHRNKQINLNKKNEEFFKDDVDRKYDHDWLHNYLAFYEEPLHNKIKVDKSKALCNEHLWNRLSYEDKIKCAMEEIYVVATERYISRNITPKVSKVKSLKNLITSMTKGWFNLFLIENFDTLLAFDNTHWINKLKDLK